LYLFIFVVKNVPEKITKCIVLLFIGMEASIYLKADIVVFVELDE